MTDGLTTSPSSVRDSTPSCESPESIFRRRDSSSSTWEKEEEEGKTEEGKEGKKVKKVKMEVVGGSGQEVATVTSSSRARWAVGYGSEEDAWLVGNLARNMVRTEQREAEFRRPVDRRRLDVVDRLALLNVEGNNFCRNVKVAELNSL